ncbi:MAG: MFS transporter [Pseudomonadota bacterium]|nr:MFS transporter [Pseudomonadota bacterium]
MSAFSFYNNMMFIRSQWRFLMFGLLLAFFSSPGQTFFISLFSAEIRGELNLTHGDFGIIYAAGTLTSAATIIFLGRLVDVIRLRNITLLVIMGLAFATSFFSVVSSAVMLGFGIYFLRLTGQGMMTHLYATAMSRRYVAERGRAVAIATQGHPLSEVLMPAFALLLLTVMDWRQIWQVTTLLLLIIMIPATFLLSGHQQGQDGAGIDSLATGRDGHHWTTRQVIFQWRFLLLAGLVLAPSFTSTGLFFHQIYFADLKNIPLPLWASGYTVYAALSIIGAFIGGVMVDRFSASIIAPVIVTFLALPVFLLGQINSPMMVWVYFACFGLIQGGVYPVITPIWAELYGTRHLGGIKAVMHALMVFASALSPAGIGIMIDAGFGLNAILLVMGAVPVTAGILGYYGCRIGRPDSCS